MNSTKTWLLIILLLIAGVLRAATIHYGTNVDEGVYWVEGKQMFDGYWIYSDTQFNKTPLVALVAYPFFFIDENPIYPMRAAMLIFSLLGLFCIYRLARQLFGEWAGIAALAFMALEPFSCVWAKYLHTSSWTPWFQAAIFWLLVSALQNENKKTLFLSGVVLGFFALTKQSAVYVLPVALAGWFLFAQQKTIRSFVRDTLIWGGGIAIIFIPLVLFIVLSGTFPAFWHDIWTAHHKIAPWFAHHTLAFRISESQSIVWLAPALWFLSLGSFLFFAVKQNRRATLFVWIWLIVEVCGNIIFFTHLWRHYLLGVMLPFAILSGAFVAYITRTIAAKSDKMGNLRSNKLLTAMVIAIAVMMVPFWHQNDWDYPGITLEQEKNLARYVSRACEEPYVLNLTNPALYVWADKKIPPVYQDDRMTRIPYFMTLAGRGYNTREDLERTVEHWETLPVNCVVSYDRYIPQMRQNPVLEPLRDWLLNNFEARRVRVSDAYYGNFLLFERKQN